MSRLILSLFLCLFARGLRAAENPYDVFARVIAPIAAMLSSESSTQGLRADLALLSASEVDARFQGVTLSAALQMPDKLRITAQTRDDKASLIRNGQDFLAAPAGPAQEILNEVAPGLLAYKGNIQAEVPGFKLPIPRQQLAFLPALFAIEDLGVQEVDGARCRLLDVRLTPELVQGEAGQWSARLWIDPAYRPVLIELHGQKGAQVRIAVKSLEMTDDLPKELWSAAEGEEALTLSPAQILQLIDALRGQMRM